MFSLLDRIPSGVEPMLTDIEEYIFDSGIADMKACVEIITTVSVEEREREREREREGEREGGRAGASFR